MKTKTLFPLLLASAVTAAHAEEYQSITDFDYSRTEIGSFKTDQYTLGSTYYFTPRMTMGPLKEFEYINRSSNVFGGYSYFDTDFDNVDSAIVGGEYFAGNLLVGGAYQNTEDQDAYYASVGYLASPDLLFRVDAEKFEDQDTDYFASAQYNHRLGGSDYLGFTLRVDDDLDYRELSSKYFAEFGRGSYIALSLNYASLDGDYVSVGGDDNTWSTKADYYFNKATSVGLGYDKDDNYLVDFSHFFQENIALELAYSSNADDSDLDTYTLGLRAQF